MRKRVLGLNAVTPFRLFANPNHNLESFSQQVFVSLCGSSVLRRLFGRNVIKPMPYPALTPSPNPNLTLALTQTLTPTPTLSLGPTGSGTRVWFQYYDNFFVVVERHNVCAIPDPQHLAQQVVVGLRKTG